MVGNLDFFPTLISLMRKLRPGSRSPGEAEDSVAGVRQAGKVQGWELCGGAARLRWRKRYELQVAGPSGGRGGWDRHLLG